MFATSQHAHFIGIGGIGMSGIAEILLNLGMKVSGSDLAPRRSPIASRNWAQQFTKATTAGQRRRRHRRRHQLRGQRQQS